MVFVVVLKALELRAEGQKANEVAKASGFHPGSVTPLAATDREYGLAAIPATAGT